MAGEKEEPRRNFGDIPCLFVSGENIPEAWEKAVLKVYDEGVEIKTEYDHPGDPPSLDATVMIEVKNPFAEPRIHKNLPGGPTDLESYRQEVVKGIHDHWINPAEGKWTYTYHERLFNYRPSVDLKIGEKGVLIDPRTGNPVEAVDQTKYLIEKLSQAPHSRRVQMTTWIPTADPDTNDPPCLQRIWARILPNEKGEPIFNMNTYWRSRDLYKAWFMNVFAITDLQRILAEKLSEKMGVEVKIGRYVDVSDSLHIYGSYRNDDLEAEIKKMRTSPYAERAWNSRILEPMFEEVRENLARDPDFYAKGDER